MYCIISLTISNTEREINAIVKHLDNRVNHNKTIVSYFKELEPNDDQGQQERRVRRLKKKLTSNPRWLYKNYKDTHDFEVALTHDLYKILIRMNSNSFKIEQLKRFWQVGKVDDQLVPTISIIYPPVQKECMPNKGVGIGQKRLLPHIYFEDYKALHKIMKNLSMVGLKDYSVYSKYDLPQDYDKANIVWICLPRLKRGIDELKSYTNRRFDISITKGEATINWKVENGEIVEIKSPLKTYLELQRDPKDEKDLFNNNIIVKDYAIIARFDRNTEYENPGTESLKSFFLAGIHGLGTWGASWLIDRKYGIFKDKEMDGDLQMLVEVEYKNGKIAKVIDVSDKNQEYFDNQNKKKNIQACINQFKEL